MKAIRWITTVYCFGAAMAGAEIHLPKASAPVGPLPVRAGRAPETCTFSECLKGQDFAKKDRDGTPVFSAGEVALVDALVAGREPRFADVTRLWLQAAIRRHNALRGSKLVEGATTDVLRKSLEGAAPGNWLALKATFEAKTRTRLDKRDFTLNADWDSPLDGLFYAKTDVAGYAAFSQLAARIAWGEKAYRESKPVVVVTPKGFLAGAVRDDSLVAWDLAVKGAGERSFGKIADLGARTDALRVVDAELYAVVEILRDRISPEAQSCLLRLAVQKTGERLSFDPTGLERNVAALPAHRAAPTGARRIGTGAVFHFGEIPVGGDRTRPQTVAEDGLARLRAEWVKEIGEEKTAFAEREASAALRSALEKDGKAPADAAFLDAVTERHADTAEAKVRLGAYLASRARSQAPEKAVEASLKLHRAIRESEALLARYGVPATKIQALATAESDGLGRAGKARETAIEASLYASLTSVKKLDPEGRRTIVASMKAAVLQQLETDNAWLPAVLPGLAPGGFPTLPPTPPRRRD